MPEESSPIWTEEGAENTRNQGQLITPLWWAYVEREGKARLTVIGEWSLKDVVRKIVKKEATGITDHGEYLNKLL